MLRAAAFGRVGRGRISALAGIVVLTLVVTGLTAPARMSFDDSKLDGGLLDALHRSGDNAVGVIVRETHAASSAAEKLVVDLGGRVSRELWLIDGFAARVPAAALDDLASSASVETVSGDASLQMNGTWSYDGLPPNTAWRKSIRLNQVDSSYTGAGTTVAVLDTGIWQSPDFGDRVVARVDFTPDRDGYDRFGHGTHVAGVIGGDGSASNGTWSGVAPGSDLVSVKVAGADGSTDVSVVIAALQWILVNKTRYGIDVLNLAFGTDSLQSYSIDPLNYAVERVWLGGIFVVVSAGNRGAGTMNKPADDPFVLTVGAADLKDTVYRDDDVVAQFSSWGATPDSVSKPDLVAPGITVVATSAGGSAIELAHPAALVDGSYMKGTGTSQAAAVVSGVAALMYQADPLMTPDVAKATLLGTAFKSATYRSGGGAGLVDAEGAVLAARNGKYRYAPANVGLIPSTGVGSLQASRGSFRVYADANADGTPEPIEGEIDVLGMPWTATSWSATSWGATSWSSLVCETPGWNATSWSATSWSGTSWSATSWGATSWGATSWSADTWS
jgi:serine protease AprX